MLCFTYEVTLSVVGFVIVLVPLVGSWDRLDSGPMSWGLFCVFI